MSREQLELNKKRKDKKRIRNIVVSEQGRQPIPKWDIRVVECVLNTIPPSTHKSVYKHFNTIQNLT